MFSAMPVVLYTEDMGDDAVPDLARRLDSIESSLALAQ